MSDSNAKEFDARCDFARSYEQSKLPAVKALERDVLGCDYGGTSWTTLGQVPHIVASLGSGRGMQLLEAGAEELRTAIGADAFAESVARRKEQVRVVRAGVLVRSVYVAIA